MIIENTYQGFDSYVQDDYTITYGVDFHAGSSETVRFTVERTKVFSDNSTDFSNETATAFVTREQALAFARLIIEQLA